MHSQHDQERGPHIAVVAVALALRVVGVAVSASASLLDKLVV
jgi:hypothetical protein